MYTQMVGDPTNRPTISVPHTYGDQYVIDGYPSDGGYWNRAAATLNFQKSIENIIIDTTAVGGGFAFSQINWAVAQGTALRNIDFNMAAGSKQTGISMEGGSGGGGSGTFMGDLTFNGGQTGINLSNQQFHIKNVVFNGVTTGIYVDHCFIAVLQGMQFNNCTTGVDAGNANSISLIDSSSSGTDTVVSATKQSPSNTRSIVIENLDATDAQTIVKRSDNGQVLLDGGQGQQTVASFVRGATFDLSFNKNFTGGSLDVNPPQRPSSMLQNGKYTTKQKPTFPDTQAADVVNVRDEGAKGDGSTDDLQALQTAINNNVGKIIYFPYGVYRITDTLNVPAGSILKGEAWPTIRAAGPSAWKDQSNPKAVVQLGSQNGGNVSSSWTLWSRSVTSTRVPSSSRSSARPMCSMSLPVSAARKPAPLSLLSATTSQTPAELPLWPSTSPRPDPVTSKTSGAGAPTTPLMAAASKLSAAAVVP